MIGAPRPLLAALALALALGGCGSDAEKKASSAPVGPSTSAPTQAPARTESTQAQPPAQTEPRPTTSTGATTEPGAGDERPISTPVMVTGRGGRVRPKLVQVPAFIAVRITLRSSDQLTYQLDVEGKTIGVDVEKREASLMLGGLRPGKSYVARGPNGMVVISASGEPGP